MELDLKSLKGLPQYCHLKGNNRIERVTTIGSSSSFFLLVQIRPGVPLETQAQAQELLADEVREYLSCFGESAKIQGIQMLSWSYRVNQFSTRDLSKMRQLHIHQLRSFGDLSRNMLASEYIL